MFLYEDLEVLRRRKKFSQAPEYIAKNLNPAFELRPYQVQAFENFVEHFESDEHPRPLQVLFHMATGSGKTLIMAGLILYLYKQGYRNFIFFVNLTNILDKTKANFLNAGSSKYLFADEIFIDDKKIPINVVKNFNSADDDAINICFDTTQGLHDSRLFVREGAMTTDDFNEMKVVFIADEAHHLNVDTKKGKAAPDNNYLSWENTVKEIFSRNNENILLEFTATCDLNNEDIKNFYEDKIIFDYPLQKFYDDKYSKDIVSLRSDFSLTDKALQALVLSQYRLKLFQDNRLNIKPAVLFKSAKIADSKNFMAEFIDTVKNLESSTLQRLSQLCNEEIMHRAFEYFERKGITLDMLAAELREDFSEEHCISANEDTDAEQKQILLNSLEDADNPYRAIFEVKKLDEGWDVLNLFDIVRLYETRRPSSIISEAQLIGRGSRYCPFKLDAEQPKFQRKYDSDVNCELRVCETLYYHCQNDSEYIIELKDTLRRELGLNLDKAVEREYKLKDSFKADDIYKSGIIFLNKRVEKSRVMPEEVPLKIREKIYGAEVNLFKSGTTQLLTDAEGKENRVEVVTTRTTIGEIAAKNFAIVNNALMKFPNYQFNRLKEIFPKLRSTKEFVTDEKFLGDIKIDIKSPDENLSATDLHNAVCQVLKELSAVIVKPKIEYEGTKEFYSHDISKIFTDKKVIYSDSHKGGLGESQKDSADFKLDLSDENWFAHTDNFGTSEEKALVAYVRDYIKQLKERYDKVFLVRNERQFQIYSFEDGARFEPDFVLLLQKNSGNDVEHWQIFIEPKGKHLLLNDDWKEKFLLQLKDNAVYFYGDKNYSIWGFHFFNNADKKDFDKDFGALLES